MKIQLDIPKGLNKKVKIMKEIKGFRTLAETVLFMLDDYNKIKNVDDLFKMEMKGK